MDTLIEQVLTEINASIGQISSEAISQAGAIIEDAPRVFAAGAGRSGLCIRAFGMRLMQLGKTSYVVGETSTPSIQQGDLLVLGSGTGLTDTLLVIAHKAQRLGAKILLFTTDGSSPMAALADNMVIIPAPSLNTDLDTHEIESIQPMGSLFEQVLLILCDRIVLELLSKSSIEQMREQHANLE